MSNGPSGVSLSSPEKPFRVLFADFAVVKYNPVINILKEKDVVCEGVTDPPKFIEKIHNEFYDLAVVNLLLGGIGPFELIKSVRQNSMNSDIRIIVVSRQVQKANIQNTIKAGASDFVADPFEVENLSQRILYHLGPKKILDPSGFEDKKLGGVAYGPLCLLLEATEELSRMDRGKEHATFLKILQNVAKEVDSNRTSLIIVEPESSTGVVLASSDDPNFYDFPIALNKYPEILHVMHSASFVLIEDVARNSLTQKINDKVKSIPIGSLLVFPVRFQNEVTGVLTIRRPRAQEVPPIEVLRVLQAIANTLAAQSNVKALLRKLYKEYSPKTG
jgi:CheY-like chemotaxis protein